MNRTVVIGGETSLIQKIDGNCSLSVNVDGVSGVVTTIEPHARATYGGDYIVVPKVTEQVLQTKEKVMSDDLTVTGIPTYQVSNPSGGDTFYIADNLGG